tara:strand:- start:1056 stop:5294 length:4239 start_codon:yes stop_codon:yes gene_type:complete
MMMKLNYLFALFLLTISYLSSYAQQGFTDDFSDGNFTINPTWVGETSKFQIDGNNQLQLNDGSASSPAYLVTNSTVINDASWEFYVEMDFSPSGSNYAEVYLVSSQQDLNQNLNGYFVRIGGVSGTVDDVSLYRQIGASTTKIIDGIDGLVGQQPVKVKVRVTKSATGLWELFADTSALLNNPISQGTVTDLTHPQSAFFGVKCYYTSTRSDKFFFDDFVVNGLAFQDTIKPTADTVIILSSNQLEVRFSEFVDVATATNPSNFSLSQGIGAPTSVFLNAADSSRITLDFANTFTSGLFYDLDIQNVEDRNGNAMLRDTLSFFYFVSVAAAYRDVVINEFYADPSPSFGLPSGEFIEIYNASQKVFDLKDWEIADGSSTRLLPSYILQPQEYVIICSNADVNAYQTFGTVVPVSTLPSLNNSGDDIVLTDNNAQLVDQLSYGLSWYDDASKENGGWTIEQINPETACTGKVNFAASIATVGGTPGTQNSIYNTSPDVTPPVVIRASALSADSVLVEFNEFMDSSSIVNGTYAFSTSAVVGQVFNQAPAYTQALLILSTPLDSGIVHTLVVSNVRDCSGNTISGNNIREVVLPASATYRDVVINELFTDVSPSFGLPQVDFVELFNASDKILNLEGWELEDAVSGGELPYLIFKPGEFIVLCPSADVAVYQSYGPTLGIQSFPLFNNSGDQVKLYDNNRKLIDRIDYTDDWYQDETKANGGFSLEQINPYTDCNDRNNFKASNNIQGGSPASQNSVFDTIPDTTPPILISAEALSVDSIRLYFNERLDSNSVQTANYTFSSSANVSTALNEGPSYNTVLLILVNTLDSGVVNTITVNNISDCPGNVISSQNQAEIVVPGIPTYRDVVINEFMCDPSPQVGLPDADFIELFNASQKIFDLSNWTLADNSTISTLQNLIFRPGEYVIICAEGNVAAFSSFGQTLGQSSFPSLTNGGDEIILKDPNGNLVDYVNYTDQWYRDDEKKNGGYTLEQINPNLPCSGESNFIASAAGSGGTPAAANSLLNTAPDLSAPLVSKVLVFSEDTIALRFNESLDSNSIITAVYNFSDGNTVKDFVYEARDLSQVLIVLNNPLDSGEVVHLDISDLSDCSGNVIAANTRVSFALPEATVGNDLVINEILFNPRTGGSDFVELYNRSQKVVSLQNWMMANWHDDDMDDNDSIANREVIIEEPYLVFPGDYVGLTENVDNIVKEYPSTVRSNFIEVENLPSYNDEEGGVFLLNQSNQEIDGVFYEDDMQFELLNDDDGVSLERLDPNRSSDDRGNFHSAAENVGFATPGYKNSQSFTDSKFNGEITIDPETFSPDNDGFQDVLNINYQFNAPGFVANVTVYDRAGREIYKIAQNELLGAKGTFSWDGIDADGNKVRVGIYVLFFESFNTSGAKEVFKETFVVAAKLD